MANEAESYLNTRDVFVTIEVTAEVVYVLRNIYSMDRAVIAETLVGFLELVRCRDMDVLRLALETFGENNLDFVDCVLYGYYVEKGAQIATFDQKLLKMIDESR